MAHKGKAKTKKRERFAMKHPEGRRGWRKKKREIKLEKRKQKRKGRINIS